MKRIRHTAEQIIRKLKTAEQLIAQDKTVADVCRAIEVTHPTYHQGLLEVKQISVPELVLGRVPSRGVNPEARLP